MHSPVRSSTSEHPAVSPTRSVANLTIARTVARVMPGLAHELGTPLQYVGDNLRFLDSLIRSSDTIGESAIDSNDAVAAVSEALEGVEDLRTMLEAFRWFNSAAHARTSRCDAGNAVRQAVHLTRHEWKYRARIETVAKSEVVVTWPLPELKATFSSLLLGVADCLGRWENPSGDLASITIRTTSVHAGVELQLTAPSRALSSFSFATDINCFTEHGLILDPRIDQCESIDALAVTLVDQSEA